MIEDIYERDFVLTCFDHHATHRPSSYPNDHSNNGSPPKPPDGMWDWEEIAPLHVDVEVNPFTGKPFFNEVVFYHTRTKSLLMTDLYWNYPRSDGIVNSNYMNRPEFDGKKAGAWELAPNVETIPWGSRLWKVGMDQVYRPFYMNWMIVGDRREEFERMASFMSGVTEGGWEVENIVPCHGDVVRGKSLVRGVLKDHFNLQ